MKELERYLGESYSDIYQSAIMTETLAAFIDPEMMTILKENVYKHLKTDNKITYL